MTTKPIPGDYNGDGKVDIKDTIAKALDDAKNSTTTTTDGSSGTSTDSSSSTSRNLTPRITADSQLDQDMVAMFGRRATAREKSAYFKTLNSAEKKYVNSSSSSSSNKSRSKNSISKSTGTSSSTSTSSGFDPNSLRFEFVSNLAANYIAQGKTLGGKASDTYDQIKTYAANMGIAYTDANALQDTLKAIKGIKDVNAITKDMRSRSISLHSGLADRLLADPSLTVKSASQDYINAMSSMLDIPAASINLNDPTLQKAINASKDGKGYTMSLNEFNQSLRQDHRFSASTMAKNEARDMAQTFAQAFGFGG